MLKALAVAVLGVGLLAPVVPVFAQDPPHKVHEWNDGEKDAFHRYLKEKHIKDHEWDHASKREKANYWKWRDAHPDAH